MIDDEQMEARQPPIGLAGFVCFAGQAVIYLATRPFIDYLDRWGIQWLLYTSIPISVAFIILYRSSWHQELGRFTRVLSMLLSAFIIFCCALLIGGIIVGGLYVVGNNFTAFHY